MRGICIEPLHELLLCQQEGEWVWLPASEWQLRCWHDRICARHWPSGREQLLRWSSSGFVERFEVSLDLQRGRVKLIVHEPNRRLQLLCQAVQGSPLWRLERYSCREGSSGLAMQFNADKLTLLPKQSLGLGGELQAPLALARPNVNLSIWFGTNKRLQWRQLLERSNPFELAHLLVRACNWLPSPLLGASHRIELTNPFGLDWLTCWQRHCLASVRGVLLLESTEGACDFLQRLAALSGYFIQQWIQESPEQILLHTDASTKTVSGRFKGYQSVHHPVWLSAYWCKSRIRIVELRSEQKSRLKLNFKPLAKGCRLTCKGKRHQLDLGANLLTWN